MHVKRELDILKYWEENKTFEKSVNKNSKIYTFYDGPPFATGLPHYGHLVGSFMKDAIPRYFTMKGYKVERKWGWDCHGLPVENIIEQDLDLRSKKDIEEYGVTNFNNACRASVLKYANEWKKTIKRVGRWVDMENDYKTMNPEFMESIWWVFSELYKNGLIYQGKKSMHICPRCETTLSNFEVTQGYKEVKDISVTAKFKLEKNTYILAWTTTPWTLPGNVLLAVNKNITYVKIKSEENFFIIAKEQSSQVKGEIVEEFKGEKLVGKTYTPIFKYFKNNKNSFKIVEANFVGDQDGTGIVHIAPAFGEDDYELGRKYEVEWIQHVDTSGRFTEDVSDFKGLKVKPKENPVKTDIEIIKWLHYNDGLFSKQKYTHTYPHCWRCDTPLLNYASDSWFVEVTKIKQEMLKNNQKINWEPAHIKDGRFGKWLENAKDWAISRSRYWGTPLPIWKSQDNDIICVSSIKELEDLSGQKITDLHKEFVDKIIIEKNGKKYYKIPEVLDCWFESGSMPYAQNNYPFENKEKVEKGFPANFIAEGQDQTRGWFYTLHVLATALTLKGSIKGGLNPAFKNVIVNGIVLAEDGKKMSKRLKNYPDPHYILESYGADAVRYYLLSSPVVSAKNLNFSENGVREIYNKVINTLWNTYKFYDLYKTQNQIESKNKLDLWILSKLENLNKTFQENMDVYKLAPATIPIQEFIQDLSQWYLRRSRDKLKNKNPNTLHTLKQVLLKLTKIMAPITPFITEKIHLEITKKSVHLQELPSIDEKIINNELENEMTSLREIVTKILDLREKNKLPVRQPLNKAIIKGIKYDEELTNLITQETNLKEIKYQESDEISVELDTKLDEELLKEGILRNLIRQINFLRKKQKLTIKDYIEIGISKNQKIWEVIKQNEEELKKSVQAKKILETTNGEKAKINDYEILIELKNT
ncbi:MAG: isoleucine--tRNA ligase [Candidatus Woesearchaeota archaeon]